jgi:ABC-type dipeptide/oligopeptide/nickel transport system ATPase component
MQPATGPAPYEEDEPIPGIDEYVQNCFPASGLIHRTMHHLVQTGYTSPFHHLAALLPAVANTMALRGWGGVGRGRQVAIQTVLVGPSGSAKSTAIREVMRLTNEVTRAYYGPQFNEKLHDRWIPFEGTVPGLLETLHDMYVEEWNTPLASYQLNTTPAILYSEELPVSMLIKQEALKVMLELFDPVPKVDRRLKEYRRMEKAGQKAPSCVTAPAVSAVFATTPSTLEAAFQSNHIDGGLAMRVIWAYARGDIGRLTIDTPDHTDSRREVVRYWVKALEWHDAMAVSGKSGDRMLPLTPTVKELLAFIQTQAKDAHAKHDDRTVALKVRGLNQAQMVAQVFAWSRGDTAVHPDDLERAMNFIAMAHESFDEIAGLIEVDDNWRLQQKLLKAIESSGGLSRSECYRVLQCSRFELEQVLEALKERQLIDLLKRATGGRPVEKYVPKRAAAGETGVVLPFVKREEAEKT